MKKNIGFTLIELLVVIVIIAILLGLSLMGIQGARKSSRDARRKADLETVRSALELYKADKHNYIIVSGIGWVNIATGTGPNGYLFRDEIKTYLAEVPEDPRGVVNNACTSTTDNSGYFYRTLDSGTTYEIVVGLESGESSCDTLSSCNNPTNCYFVTNP